MKIIITLTAALLCVLFVDAQITLTQADFGNQFYHAIQANDTLVDTAYIHIGSPSASSQTWNFDSLHNIYTDTLQFMSVGSTPYSSSFGAANIAFTQSNNQGSFNFLNSTATGLTAIGAGFNQGYYSNTTPNQADILSTPQIYMPFPSSYDSTFAGNTHTAILIDTTFTYSVFTIDTVKILHYITYSSILDAWGSLTTPLGTFQSLRQKYSEHTADSVFVHTTAIGWIYGQTTILDSSLTYRWFANGQGFSLVEINMVHDTTNHVWNPKTADWIYSSNTGIPKVSNTSKVSIYPNPASSEINVMNTSNDAVEIAIYDMMGNKIDAQRLTDRLTNISTAHYAAGFYSYRILDINNSTITSGKLSILK